MSPQLPGSVEEELYDDVLPVGNLLFTMRAFYICVTCLRFSGGELRQKYGVFFSEVKRVNSNNNSKFRATSPFYYCIYLTGFQNTHSPNFGSLERLRSILILWDCESLMLKIEISLGICNIRILLNCFCLLAIIKFKWETLNCSLENGILCLFFFQQFAPEKDVSLGKNAGMVSKWLSYLSLLKVMVTKRRYPGIL